ncbi:MAG: homoserine dehydrogenase [Chloroflexota bacterium]
MPPYRLALLGFGNVGQAFARLLLRKKTELKDKYALNWKVTGIATGHHGIVIDQDGLDLEHYLRLAQTKPWLINPPTLNPPITSSLDFIRHCHADVLFENTPVNYETGQPAVDHLKTALELGMHTITANKGPVVHAYHQLKELSTMQGKKFLFESTVMDGAPVFSLFRRALPGAHLQAFSGILNSTTNLILTCMEEGHTFEEAVAYAQSIGIAESDPAGDIDGWDAAVKVAALVTVLMDTPFKPQDVERQGIRYLSPQDVEQVRKQGKRWKLVCSAQKDGNQVKASVSTQKVGPDSPLYHVMGTSSMLQFQTDVLGDLSIIENHPSPDTTAYGLLADFIYAVSVK